MDALVLGPSAALNRDPTPLTSVNITSRTVPQPSVSSNPQHFNLQAWCLGMDSSKASLWKKIAAPQRSSTRTIYKSK